MFVRPVEELLESSGWNIRTGRKSAVDVITAPEEDQRLLPAWKALSDSKTADGKLLQLLAAGVNDPLLDGWLDAVRPLPIDSFPSSLLDSLPSFDGSRLDRYPFPPVFVPYSTSPIPPYPQQVPASFSTPHCPRPKDLYAEGGYLRLKEWISAQRRDLMHIREQLKQGVSPDLLDRRHRPFPIAIGQTEMAPWARGRVWDCRGMCCVVMDMQQQVDSDLNLDYLTEG